MSDLSAAQIQQFADLLEKDPKATTRLRALLGIKDTDHEVPAPTTTSAPSTSTTIVTSAPSDANSGKKKEETTTLETLDSQPRQETEFASDILAVVRDFNIPRRVKFEISTFVPNLSALFAVLFEMDKFATKKFKVRRALLSYSPAHNILWFSFLVNLQVARCLAYAQKLSDPDDIDTLETLIQTFPPEKLHIPGPLLPFFKALTTYKVQNELYGRVSPAFPMPWLHFVGNNNNVTNNNAGPVFPHFPVIVDLIRHYHTDLSTVDEKKLADKFSKFYPFELADTSDPSKGFKASIELGGHTYDKDPSKWDDNAAAVICNPALRYRPPYNKDLVSNLKDVLEDYSMPTPNQASTTNNCLKDILCVQSVAWIRDFLAPMAAYASIWKGSGTLADCSLDGPSVGAYIVTYSENETKPKKPVHPFDPASRFNLSGRIRTTQGSKEPITERLAALTQIHARLSSDNWFKNFAANRSRLGNAWNQGPVYGPSNEDHSLQSISEAIPRFLEDRLLM